MFYYRYLAVVGKIELWKIILIHSYIWIVLIGTWFYAYTIAPIWVNVHYNTSDPSSFTQAYTALQHTQSWALVVYNIIFVLEFVRILYHWSIGKFNLVANVTFDTSANIKITDPRIIISIKSLIHCFVTGFSGILWLYYPWGTFAYQLTIVLSLHFLFNYKLEKKLMNLKLSQILPAFSGSGGVETSAHEQVVSVKLNPEIDDENLNSIIP